MQRFQLIGGTEGEFPCQY